MLTYTNKRNKQVQLTVTRHAYSQFATRYRIYYKDSVLLDKDITDMFEKVFSRAQKVTKLSRKEKIRLKRHGEDTMFFRTNGFTFVIQNAQIMTVELSDKGTRHLN
jgi:hypothetical protein